VVVFVVGVGRGSGLFLYLGPFSEEDRLRFRGTAVCSVIPSRVSLFCTSMLSCEEVGVGVVASSVLVGVVGALMNISLSDG